MLNSNNVTPVYSIIQFSWLNTKIKTKPKLLTFFHCSSFTHVIASLAAFSCLISSPRIRYTYCPLICSSNVAHLKLLLPRTSMAEASRHHLDLIPLVLYVAFHSLDHLILLEFSFPWISLTLHYRLFSSLTGYSSVFFPRIKCLHLPLMCFSP